MQKKLLPLLFFLLFFSYTEKTVAQAYYGSYNSKKYYVAASYGFGTTRWYSRFENTYLYNTDGSVLRSGDLKMKAVNPNYNYNFSVCFPVGNARLGAGISFEEFSMDKLMIISLSDSATSAINIPNSYVLFTENFWFNKIYLMLQEPFQFSTGKPYELDFVLGGGFYGYDGLTHLNFFGDSQIARTLFVNTSFIFDYRVIKATRIFIQPMFEYKYFHNNGNEYPSVIIHNIFSATLNFGVRVNIAKLQF